jgi:hypothetical protein
MKYEKKIAPIVVASFDLECTSNEEFSYSKKIMGKVSL